jgi:hypothetical protein
MSRLAGATLWLGGVYRGVVTAALFEIGKFPIGFYIGQQGLGIEVWCRIINRGSAGVSVPFVDAKTSY